MSDYVLCIHYDQCFKDQPEIDRPHCLHRYPHQYEKEFCDIDCVDCPGGHCREIEIIWK